MIDAKTKVCAVIGNPIEHSLSPAIHNTAFKKKKQNYAYVAFRVENLKEAMPGVRAMGLKGLSVTIPHKVAVMEYLDDIDPVARNIGAVNTVVHQEDGTLWGTNTDGTGALSALKSAGAQLENARVVLIGSGGAARAIAFTLACQTSIRKLTITGVEMEQLEALADDVRAASGKDVSYRPADPATYAEILPDTGILINASPVGMSPKTQDTPVDAELINQKTAVFDIVYNPLKTRLLKEAEAKGCLVVPGAEMFVQQAVAQFELWTGQNAPVKEMRQVVLYQLGEKSHRISDYE